MPRPTITTDVGVMVSSQLDGRQLQELQHFAELGRLSASLLHEISNPLTAALLNLELIGNQLPQIRQVRRDMQTLRRYVDAAQQQIRQESRITSFCIRPQIEQLKRIIRPIARKAEVQVIVEPVPHCRLYGDPVKFQQIAANLIVNAIDAYRAESADKHHKIVRIVLSFNERQLTVRVVDWGDGISREQLDHLFKPFYTTKSHAGHGIGLGLAIVRQYVTADFGGSVSVSSSRRYGTQFVVKVPAMTGIGSCQQLLGR